MEKITRALLSSDLAEILHTSKDIWPMMRGKRLFITGGTGFFGLWLLESLAAANQELHLNCQATVLSRNPGAFALRAPQVFSLSNVRWVEGSAVDFSVETVAGKLGCSPKELTFDMVIHLTTESDNDKTLADPASAIEVIVGSTRQALKFSKDVGARRFLFTSSGSIYGPQPPDVTHMSENSVFAADASDWKSAYAISGSAKLAAEKLCAECGKGGGMEILIARCFAFSGPGLPVDGKFALGNFLGDALAGRDIIVKGDGTPIRSYLYASDLASWLWTILVRGAAGRIYNVGSEKAVSIRETAESVRRQISPRSNICILTPLPDSPRIHRYVPSTERARSELGLSERVDLEEAIRRTVRWSEGKL